MCSGIAGLSRGFARRPIDRPPTVASVSRHLPLSDRVRVIGVVLLVAAVTAFVLVAHHRFNSDVAEDRKAGERAQSVRTIPPTLEDSSTNVVVMGDSFTGGSNMNTGPTWPRLLGARSGWKVELNFGGGSGYVAKGDSEPFPARVAKLPVRYTDLFILAGGLNDADVYAPTRTAEAARKVIRELHEEAPDADIAILSPFCNGTDELRPSITNTAAALQQVAIEEGVTYVDVTKFLPSSDVGVDGTHPTDAGHEVLAQRIGEALLAAGLPRADAWQPAA